MSRVPHCPCARSRSWSGVSCEAGYVSKVDPYDFAWEGSTHLLVLTDFMRTDGETYIAGLAKIHDKDLRGVMAFIPSGVGLTGWIAPTKRNNTYIAVYLDPAKVPADLDEPSPRVELEPVVHFRDGAISSTIAQLAALLDEASPCSVYAETLGLLLGIEICRAHQRLSRAVPQR